MYALGVFFKQPATARPRLLDDGDLHLAEAFNTAVSSDLLAGQATAVATVAVVTVVTVVAVAVLAHESLPGGRHVVAVALHEAGRYEHGHGRGGDIRSGFAKNGGKYRGSCPFGELSV